MVKFNEIIQAFIPNFEIGKREFQRLVESVPKSINELFEREKMVVIADDDADGIISSALFVNMAKNIFGVKNIPIKFSEDGYDIALQNLKVIAEHFDTFVFIDCGTNAIENLKFLEENGKKVFIFDHHLPNDEQNNIYKKISCYVNMPNEHVSAAGVVFVSLLKILMLQGLSFEEAAKKTFMYLPFVATAALADMIEINELVAYIYHNADISFNKALNNSKGEKNPILDLYRLFDLTSATKYRKVFNSFDFSFYLAPTINSIGRISPEKLFSYLTGNETFKEINTLYKESIDKLKLFEECETKVFNGVVISIIDAENLSDKDLRFLKGFKGRLANKKLQEHEEAIGSIVMVINGDMIIGSIRARDVQVKDEISKYKNFIDFGGHDKAAGFSLKKSNLDELLAFLENIKWKNENLFERKIIYDYNKVENFTVEEVEDLIIKCGPWGVGRTLPLFKIEGKIYAIERIREDYGFKLFIYTPKKSSMNVVLYFGKLTENINNFIENLSKKNITIFAEPQVSYFLDRKTKVFIIRDNIFKAIIVEKEKRVKKDKKRKNANTVSNGLQPKRRRGRPRKTVVSE